MLLETAGPVPKEGWTNVFCSKDQDEKVEKELMFETDFFILPYVWSNLRVTESLGYISHFLCNFFVVFSSGNVHPSVNIAFLASHINQEELMVFRHLWFHRDQVAHWVIERDYYYYYLVSYPTIHLIWKVQSLNAPKFRVCLDELNHIRSLRYQSSGIIKVLVNFLGWFFFSLFTFSGPKVQLLLNCS